MGRFICLFATAFLVATRLMAQQPGTLRWRIPIGNVGNSAWYTTSSPALAADGTIYVANGFEGDSSLTTGRRLYSVTPDGTTNWVITVGRDIVCSPTVGPDGTLYVGSTEGLLYSFNRAGGTNWLIHTAGQIFSSPALAADGTVYVTSVSNHINQLYSIHPDGSTNWIFKMGPVAFAQQNSAQFSSPAIGPDGSIYIGSMDTNVYSISRDGTTNWLFRLGNVTYGSPSVGSDGTIYIGSDDFRLHAIAPDGHQRWSFGSGSYVESSPAVGSDGTIYFGSLDGNTYALTPAGSVLWMVTGFSASPALGANGTVYLAGHDFGILRAFDAAGSNRWSLNLNFSSYIFSSPVVGPDGTIYIAAGPYLCAVYGDTPLQRAPWAMFRREALHTARSVQRAVSQPTMFPDGSFGMTLNTETGLTYRVQASTDMETWTNLATLTPTNFNAEFIDPTATNLPFRFYRLASP